MYTIADLAGCDEIQSMHLAEIRQFCKLQDEGQSLMRAAMTQLNLAAPAHHRILKFARSVADSVGVSRSSLHM
jgi:predicted ATPase with chaperone activity